MREFFLSAPPFKSMILGRFFWFRSLELQSKHKRSLPSLLHLGLHSSSVFLNSPLQTVNNTSFLASYRSMKRPTFPPFPFPFRISFPPTRRGASPQGSGPSTWASSWVIAPSWFVRVSCRHLYKPFPFTCMGPLWFFLPSFLSLKLSRYVLRAMITSEFCCPPFTFPSSTPFSFLIQ